MHHHMNDLAGELAAKAGGAFAITAGAGADNVEKEGGWIDRLDFDSLKAVVTISATLAEDATLTLAANLEDASAADHSDKGDYGDAMAAAVVATGGVGGSTEAVAVELDFDLAGAGRYVRLLVTPDLSAADTDTAILAITYVLGGCRQAPATGRSN